MTWEQLLQNKQVGSKFYEIGQNNSGGYHIVNQDVSQSVIVEAMSSEDAEEKLKYITEDYNEYCSCCGERWYIDIYLEDGNDVPTIYGQALSERIGDWFRNKAVVYFLNGSRFHVYMGKEELIIDSRHEIAYEGLNDY